MDFEFDDLLQLTNKIGSETIDLDDMLTDFVDSHVYVLAEQGFQLAYHKDLAAPALVRIDKAQFQRVLDNILSNSIKYKEGTSGRLNIILRMEGNVYRVDFIDEGRGVSPEELEKVFEGFYRTDKARSATAKGNGLGLAVTKKIVEGMHGEIWAEPGIVKGLKICLILPKTAIGADIIDD